MSSFFTLPSSVMHHPEHKSMKAAYNYYTVATKHELKDLMKDMLVVAKQVSWFWFLFCNLYYINRFKFSQMRFWKFPSFVVSKTLNYISERPWRFQHARLDGEPEVHQRPQIRHRRWKSALLFVQFQMSWNGRARGLIFVNEFRWLLVFINLKKAKYRGTFSKILF